MVNHRTNAPTAIFWNFLGLAIAIFSVGTSYSISRAKVYQLELAQYKMQVGSTLNKVQQVTDTIEQSAQRLPIAKEQKRQILTQIEASNAAIEKAEDEIRDSVKELSETE